MNISVKNAAQMLAVSEKTIYRWIKQDILPVFKVNKSYRFNRAELLEWATSRRSSISEEMFIEPESFNQPLTSLYEAVEAGGIFYRIEGQTRDEALAAAVKNLRLPAEVDRQYLEKVLIARERLASTAIGDRIAIPHPRSPGMLNVTHSTVAVCFLEHPIDFHSLDEQPVEILFLVISKHLREHLHLLSRLGFALNDRDFRDTLHNQEGREKILATIASVEHRIAGGAKDIANGRAEGQPR